MGEKGFSKSDMERVGLFSEPGYVTINDTYKGSRAKSFNESASKGKQLLPGGSKLKSAHQHGYFNSKFERVFEGEAYTDAVKVRRQYRIREAKKNVGKSFVPSSTSQKPVGLGNHYGTFSGPVGAFSPASKEAPPYKAPGKNFYTNPGKKGTGFGYVGVTLGSYSKYASDEYDRAKAIRKQDDERSKKMMKGGAFRLNMHSVDYFDTNPYKSDKPLPPVKSSSGTKKNLQPFRPTHPGRKPGGMHAGTFDPYPSHSAEPYGVVSKKPSVAVNKSGRIFFPTPGPKSAPQSSIVNHNVMREVNVNNYKNVSAVVYTY